MEQSKRGKPVEAILRNGIAATGPRIENAAPTPSALKDPSMEKRVGTGSRFRNEGNAFTESGASEPPAGARGSITQAWHSQRWYSSTPLFQGFSSAKLEFRRRKRLHSPGGVKLQASPFSLKNPVYATSAKNCTTCTAPRRHGKWRESGPGRQHVSRFSTLRPQRPGHLHRKPWTKLHLRLPTGA